MTYYSRINRSVMIDTKKQYTTVPELRAAVEYSIAHQFMVAHEDNIDQPVAQESHTQYVTSGKRSFEAAKTYRGKKIAVLNFANSHAIGGSPYYAGSQVSMPMLHAIALSGGHAGTLLPETHQRLHCRHH